MSEYHNVELDLIDEDCLVKALEELGYEPIVTKESKNLEGYQGDKRKQRANVIIPRHQVGHASNDVGFEKMSNGKYKAHISGYDLGRWTKKMQEVKQLYGKHRVVKQIKKSTKYKIKSQQKQEDGSIRIRVSVR